MIEALTARRKGLWRTINFGSLGFGGLQPFEELRNSFVALHGNWSIYHKAPGASARRSKILIGR
ncbi:MAG: hypothetical protein IPP42_01055 [Saprospiraceae bacterium]|nr:hypothetical protein [Saprospiraceae bacterium]